MRGLSILFVACASSVAHAHAHADAVAPCRVESEQAFIQRLPAAVEGGGPPVVVSIHGRAVASIRHTNATVTVFGELVVSGTLPNDQLDAFLIPGSRSRDGIVTLGARGWSLVELQGGEVALARATASGVTLSRSEWPCSAVGVGGAPSVPYDPDSLGANARSYDRVVRERTFVLRSDASPGASVTIATSGGEPLAAKVLGRRGEEAKVQVRLDRAGAVAEGFLPANQLVDPPQYGSLGTIGPGGGGGCGRVSAGGGYHGPVLVAPGVRLYREPGKRAFAVASPHGSWEAQVTRDGAWVELIAVPGVDVFDGSCTGGGIWAKRSDVAVGISQARGLTLERPWDGRSPSEIADGEAGASVRVTAVAPGSHWAAVGFAIGDRLVGINDGPLPAQMQLGELRSRLGCGGFTLVVERGSQTVRIPLPATCPTAARGIGNGLDDHEY